MELSAVKGGCFEIGQLLPDLIADGGVALKADRGGLLRRGRGFRRGRDGGAAAARRGGHALVRLLVQGIQHLGCQRAVLIMDDLAAAVQHDGLGQGGAAVDDAEDGVVVVIQREVDVPFVPALGHDIVLRLHIPRHRRVDRQDDELALVLFAELFEFRQLLYTGGAVGAPEVDDDDLTFMVGEVELPAVKGGYREVLQLLSDLIADGGAALKADLLGGGRHRRRFAAFGRCCRGGGCRRGRDRLLRRALSHGRIQEVEPEQGRAEDAQRHTPENFGKVLPAGFGPFRIIGTAAFRRLQGIAARLDGDGLLGTDLHALAAVDALMIAHMPHVHAAAAHAASAVVAAAFVDLHTDDVEAVEEAVDRTQRADKAAEGPVAEDAQQPDPEHDDELARKQDPQHGKLRGVCRVRQQAHGPLKGARRADILAEARQRHVVLEPVPQRQGHHKDRQQDVLEPAEHPRDAGFFDFRRRDLVQQLLNQAQRAEPAADRTPEDDAEQRDDPQHVPPGLVAGGRQRVLDRAQRTGADGARAGVAVKARHTGEFRLSDIDFPVDKALQMGVIQQSAVKLYQPAGAGTVVLPPGSFHIIQGPHTPYRYLRLWCTRPLRCRL